LAQAKGQAKSTRVRSKDLANIHPQDRKQSRILALRVIIRGVWILSGRDGASIAEMCGNAPSRVLARAGGMPYATAANYSSLQGSRLAI
jgi:hypothetical protein